MFQQMFAACVVKNMFFSYLRSLKALLLWAQSPHYSRSPFKLNLNSLQHKKTVLSYKLCCRRIVRHIQSIIARLSQLIAVGSLQAAA